MRKNFYEGIKIKQDENAQPLNNTYNGYTQDNNYNNSYSGYTQNYNNPFNTYGGYSQNDNSYNMQNNHNNQFGNNLDVNNGYNQNQGYLDNRYADNSSYPNNSYDNNFNNQYSYYNQNSANQQNFDNSEPSGAQVVYAKDKYGVKFSRVIMTIFVVFFVSMIIYVLLCNKPEINVVLVEQLIPMLALVLLCSIGLYVIIQPLYNFFVKKRRCTQPVTATVIDVQVSRNSNGNKNYYPTYKYYYENKIYIVSANTSRTLNRPYRGQELPMFINQYNPTDFYIESKVMDIVYLIFGIAFTSITIKMFIPTILKIFT